MARVGTEPSVANQVTVAVDTGQSSSGHSMRNSPVMKPNLDLKELPTYEEAINPNAPPPSYESLYGRVTEAHANSQGISDFLKNVAILIIGGVGCGILFIFLQLIPIALVCIGLLYMFTCADGEYIPVYLLVTGLFGLMKQLLYLSARLRKTPEEVAAERRRQTPTQTLLDCFMLAWFIIGSVWVYGRSNHDRMCSEFLYLFAYWLATSVYIALGAFTFCLCTIAMASLVMHRYAGEMDPDGQVANP